MNSSGIVLVTGTSTGLGRQIAVTLVREGFTVFAGMRDVQGKNASKAEALKRETEGKRGKLDVLEMDVNRTESVDAAVAEAVKREGSIDVVINNAGVAIAGLAETMTIEQCAQVFETNLFGVQRVNRATLPLMREKKKGLLIHISSTVGRMVIPGMSVYMASKFALEALAESYRYELSPLGIDSVIVEPGGFGTAFFANTLRAADTRRAASYGELAHLPDKIIGGFEQAISGAKPDPQSVADAILSLIRTPVGQRPLRTVVDPISGGAATEKINQTTSEVQAMVFGVFGLSDFLGPKAVD